MLDRESLLARIRHAFPSLTAVEDSVYRFERRREGGAPFAICYLDLTDRLPRTPEELADYQDRVLGRYYFEGEKSLQWSNYLYFIISAETQETPETVQAKLWIESDRRYARKFVMSPQSPEELDSALRPRVIIPTDATESEDIVTLWTERLLEAGIYEAVDNQATLASRIQMIADSSTPLRLNRTRSKGGVAQPASMLRSLELTKYRAFPCRRSFDFGLVNLLVGPNGTGKTSLLEAIELFFCGRHGRNDDAKPTYELTARLWNGRLERATHERDLQSFRDRNLYWYGIAEVGTNHLYRSFGRFNFLDTDAAVRLAETNESLQRDLSKLLMGSEAAKLWKEIERVAKEVPPEIRKLSKREAELSDELHQMKAQLMEFAQIRPESGALWSRLTEMLSRLEWKHNLSEQVPDDLLSQLSELASIAQQAKQLIWVGTPVTIERIDHAINHMKATIAWLEPFMAELEDWQKTDRTLANDLSRAQAAARLAEEAERICEVGVPERTAESDELKGIKRTLAGRLAGLDDGLLDTLPRTYHALTLAAGQEQAEEAHAEAKQALALTQAEFSQFNKLRDQSIGLAQQLRAIAHRILETSTEPDQCPLCHTQLRSGELALRMQFGVEPQLEALGQELLARVHKHEKEVHDSTAIAHLISQLITFCTKAGLHSESTILDALAAIEQARSRLRETTERLNTLEAEAARLAEHGLSVQALADLTKRLGELSYPLANPSAATITELRVTLGARSASISGRLDEARTKVEELWQNARTKLSTPEVSTEQLKELLSETKDHLVTTVALQMKLIQFEPSLPWPVARPLSELVVEAESVRKVASDLRVALETEEKRAESAARGKDRRERLQEDLTTLRHQLDRLNAANNTFNDLRSKHSLNTGMQRSVTQNQEAIEEVFARIHTPMEFSGLGSNWSTLIRKADGRDAELTEISTGQRAAFALSVFLAQNARLASQAPPVILIDDPIAHVDDLNALSFLDYLREVALKGDRQIFFATASAKLAALFERKFQFLGHKEYCRINFEREPLIGEIFE